MKKQPALTEGIKSLLGVSDEAPSVEIKAFDPGSTTVHTEITPLEKETFRQTKSDNLRNFLQEQTEEGAARAQLESLLAALAAAEEARDAATKIMKEAQAEYEKKRDEVDNLKIKLNSLDQRSDSLINREYIRKQHEVRLNTALRIQEHREKLLATGVLSQQEIDKLAAVSTKSPADVALAEHNKKKRRG